MLVIQKHRCDINVSKFKKKMQMITVTIEPSKSIE